VSIDVDLVWLSVLELGTSRRDTPIELHACDGVHGWKASVPFGRIVAWAAPHMLPTAWIERAAPGAVIVTPVNFRGLHRLSLPRLNAGQCGGVQSELFRRESAELGGKYSNPVFRGCVIDSCL